MAEKTFEKALQELETIVTQLEQGDAPLEKSMKLYEKGVGLSRFCTQELENAKLKLEELKAGGSNE
ncbi:MAG: exodeoxyribonuclease VII small subunit [Massiliimalia sp.]|jgi:exodeoxyribonuclease VII small subunit